MLDPAGRVGTRGVRERAGSGVAVKGPPKAAMVWERVEVLRATPGNRLSPTEDAPRSRVAPALVLRTDLVPQRAPMRVTGKHDIVLPCQRPLIRQVGSRFQSPSVTEPGWHQERKSTSASMTE